MPAYKFAYTLKQSNHTEVTIEADTYLDAEASLSALCPPGMTFDDISTPCTRCGNYEDAPFAYAFFSKDGEGVLCETCAHLLVNEGAAVYCDPCETYVAKALLTPNPLNDNMREICPKCGEVCHGED